MSTQRTPGGTASPERVIFVLLGATGSFAERKFWPAYLALDRDPTGLVDVVPVADEAPDRLNNILESAISGKQLDSDYIQNFADIKGNLVFDEKKGDLVISSIYREIAGAIKGILNRGQSSNVLAGGIRQHARIIYYCAVSPHLYVPIADQITKDQITKDFPNAQSTLVLEKPYGAKASDLEYIQNKLGASPRGSARKKEGHESLFLIDHYRYKSMVQQIIYARGKYPDVEAIWNSKTISSVEITVAEDFGIGRRGPTYERLGALRDMIQDHLLRILCAVAAPLHDSQALEDEQANLLPNISVKSTVRGQYTNSGRGTEQIPSYLEDAEISKSEIETFVALHLHVDTPRWEGVDFLLRTGKRMGATVGAVTLHLGDRQDEKMIFRIQPRPNIRAVGSVGKTWAKLANLDMPAEQENEYDAILKEIIDGHMSRVVTPEWVQRAWEFSEKVKMDWSEGRGSDLIFYEAGSDGPSANLLGDSVSEWMHLHELLRD